MAIQYEQILSNSYIIKAEDKKYTKKELYDIFIDLLIENNFIIIKSSLPTESPIEVIVRDNNENDYRFVVNIRNITGSGWKDKIDIKRVQVINILYSSPEKIITTNQNQAMFLLGYYNFDNNPIFVAWDFYRYTKHNTNRSCYVTINHLQRGFENGFYEGVSAQNIIWVFKIQYFSKFVEKYINYFREFRNE
ncbi:MAG TPA: hypothetical protein GX708_22495 [Gallicola sp.]|jgi:hypothetical protein|nr:hypothetical protein [Gallicola sp.]